MKRRPERCRELALGCRRSAFTHMYGDVAQVGREMTHRHPVHSMGRFSNIGKGRGKTADSTGATASAASGAKRGKAGAADSGSGRDARASTSKAGSSAMTPSGPPSRSGTQAQPEAGASKLAGRRKGKGKPKGKRGTAMSSRDRVQSAAAPLHDRRRRLVSARETTLRDLGGLMLEMYKRNRFREELLLDKCEEVLAIEVEIAHVDQRLFQLAPPNAAGMRPIGRCECGAPIHPGQNFCGVCGRSFSTLTQPRTCTKCGAGLRPGDQFCATCGHEAPDALQAIEVSSSTAPIEDLPGRDAARIASAAVAETVVIEPLGMPAPTAAHVDDAALPAAKTPSPSSSPSPASSTPSSKPTFAAATPVDPAPKPASSQPTFDWSTPSLSAEPAIDAAVDAASTDTGAASVMPLDASVPPPPIVNPVELSLPGPTQDATPRVDLAAPDVPAIDAPAPAPSERMTALDAPPPTGAPVDVSKPVDSKADKAAARKARKAEAAAARELAKEAKARAKARAKAERARRKRGDDVQ